MRYLIIIICILYVSLGEQKMSYAQDVDLTTPVRSTTEPHLQAGKRVSSLITNEAFALESVSHNLGSISSIAYDGETHYWTADINTGRIWQLTDRNKDGRIDTKRALAHRFDTPSGLAINGDTLFVADRNAIWIVESLSPPQKLAGLRNVNSMSERHSLSLSQDKGSLLLALTTKDGTVKILSVDITTGTAQLRDELTTDQNFIAFGHRDESPPWVLLENGFGSSLANLIKVNASHSLQGLAVANFKNEPLTIFNNHIYLSRQSAQGFDVLATPLNLNQLGGKSKRLLSGFLSSTKRTAWGTPGPLIFDRHGLIIADNMNGDLYRLRPKIMPPTDSKKGTSETSQQTSKGSTNADPARIRVSTIEGSQISRGSILEEGSSLSIGSVLRKSKSSKDRDAEENQKKRSDKDK